MSKIHELGLFSVLELVFLKTNGLVSSSSLIIDSFELFKKTPLAFTFLDPLTNFPEEPTV